MGEGTRPGTRLAVLTDTDADPGAVILALTTRSRLIVLRYACGLGYAPSCCGNLAALG